MSEPSPASRRARSTALDLARSLVPLVVVILVMVWLLSPADVDPVREIDPGPTIAYAATVADFTVLAARRLPEGWRATSSRVEPAAVQAGDDVLVTVGYVTPSEEFAKVVQGSAAEERLLVNVVGEGYRRTDICTDGGCYVMASDGELALVQALEGSTVIVTGSAEEAELRVLADALLPVGG